MRDYFAGAAPADAAWAVYFLSGNARARPSPRRSCGRWAAEAAGMPDWLFEESYDAVGDLAETDRAPAAACRAVSSDAAARTHWVEERLLPLPGLPEAERACACAPRGRARRTGRLVWNKLITGSFRVGVSEQLVMRALGAGERRRRRRSSRTG